MHKKHIARELVFKIHYPYKIVIYRQSIMKLFTYEVWSLFRDC